MGDIATPLNRSLHALVLKGMLRMKRRPDGMLIARPKAEGEDASNTCCLLRDDGSWIALHRVGPREWVASDLPEEAGSTVFALLRFLGVPLDAVVTAWQ